LASRMERGQEPAHQYGYRFGAFELELNRGGVGCHVVVKVGPRALAGCLFDDVRRSKPCGEQNREADRLANLAMDKGTGRKSVWPSDAPESKEVVGYVRDGVVHFLGGSLPEGSKVMVRIKK